MQILQCPKWAKAHWSGGIKLAINTGQRWSTASIHLPCASPLGEGRSYSAVNLQSSLTPWLPVQSIWLIPCEFQLFCDEMVDGFWDMPLTKMIFNAKRKHQTSYFWKLNIWLLDLLLSSGIASVQPGTIIFWSYFCDTNKPIWREAFFWFLL